ncbi:MAG: 2Fe-2S iron-sulfur cluster binding domain-containing protein [Rhodospirillales bacterium]|nr:2Fe-2S iron-sulfur cluster binding domain-containing protein [Rhodospirillales bacterium]
MALITFSSPVMKKDVTVYAVAGDRGTLLAVAKAHKIPIPFDCGNGECGSCLVEVTHLDPSLRMGLTLNEKEKEQLRQLGKITEAEIEEAEVNDMPPRYRLACQYFVRKEDILVTFGGDETLPAQRPATTHAAPIFNDRMELRSVGDFLAHAVAVEQSAADHFDELAESMDGCGNKEVAELFRQLAGYSRLHLQDAKERASAIDVTGRMPKEYDWPDMEAPEQTELWAGDSSLTRSDALKAALKGETRGFEFYHYVAETTADAEIRALAKEFRKEEQEHVKILERWIIQEEARANA